MSKKSRMPGKSGYQIELERITAQKIANFNNVYKPARRQWQARQQYLGSDANTQNVRGTQNADIAASAGAAQQLPRLSQTASDILNLDASYAQSQNQLQGGSVLAGTQNNVAANLAQVAQGHQQGNAAGTFAAHQANAHLAHKQRAEEIRGQFWEKLASVGTQTALGSSAFGGGQAQANVPSTLGRELRRSAYDVGWGLPDNSSYGGNRR